MIDNDLLNHVVAAILTVAQSIVYQTNSKTRPSHTDNELIKIWYEDWKKYVSK